ncbi:sulfide dehydrogenase (flavoprotein) subunit SudA [Desulfonatronum thiosulfatophilum]|uniref:Sulfide dehydrogenase (Flavoprotein) subunit SudA n=1 Tax=Desulfonatronum thiosulfatophilum TaxID=617002 RepID=A0A1G6BCY6_9BACT|nr:NADPH-dependent glutamate synthase [Desulfonatronum thiosulfatophilum]SDB18399.1 sulfide dehydrogenase (flavoprotein) subunit SudA [Desulfonatronum thiosulfatophilum]
MQAEEMISSPDSPARPKKGKRPMIPRQPMPEQDPRRRRYNFEEVPRGYSEETAMLEAGRCLRCKKAGCVKGCPVNINIPAFVALIAEGHFAEAADKLKEQNALPAVCGRVCPQESQCEAGCILGKKGDPVAIGRLERFAADYARTHGHEPLACAAEPSGKRVAVVGAGPAGITVAGDLARWGHHVVVFEALHLAGGVLMYGIPQFRLPKEIVQYEISNLKKHGVEIRTDMAIGMTQTVDQLLENEFDAVFIGTGAGLPMFLNIPGENAIGVFSANEFLTRINLMKAYDFPRYATAPIRPKRAITVGGGNVAMDSARTALRLGAESLIVYRRGMEEMPARVEEVHHAQEEGVEFHLLTAPKRIVTDGRNRVTGMECLRMELGEPGPRGRRRPVPVEGSEFIIPADTVIVAVGNRPNPLVPRTSSGMEVSSRGTVIANENTMMTSKPGVFAGGDIVSGAATVISAMGQGKQAARAMHKYMTGEEPPCV